MFNTGAGYKMKEEIQKLHRCSQVQYEEFGFLLRRCVYLIWLNDAGLNYDIK